MRTRLALAVLLTALCACAAKRTPVPRLEPLGGAGELHVFSLPFPREADRLSFTIEAIALRRADGTEVPLLLGDREVVGTQMRDQRFLAWGRVPRGEYAGLSVKIRTASLLADGEAARLLVPAEPAAVEFPIRMEPGEAAVLWLALDLGKSLRSEAEFSPAFTPSIPPQTPPQVALYCTNIAGASVTAAERRTRLVTGVIPVGAAPRGIAIDPVAGRAYVALAAEDELEIVDLAVNRSAGRIRLTPGDGPGEVALAADGVLLVVNERSRTLSFVDPAAIAELGRVPVGDGPVALLLDRTRRRAFVANRGSGTITVIDVPNRAVAATLATEPEPLRMAVNRDNSRLFVVHRGSPYLGVFALPSLAPLSRAYVGLGATTLKVDPRSDLIYLSRGEERRIAVYDPVSLQPADQFDVPGAVSYMAIDDAENALLALMPERRTIGVVDLTSRRLLAEIPVGAEPYFVALPGERF